MDVIKLKKTILSTVGAVVGGGVAGGASALFDPAKYSFPKDFGTGKLWPYVFTGAGLTLGGMFLHSNLGQKIFAGITRTQQQIAADQAAIQQAKADLKGKTNGPQGDGKPNQEK